MKKFLLCLPLVLAVHAVNAVTIFDPFADATANGGTAYPVGATFANTNKNYPALVNATGGPWYGVTNTFPTLPPGIPVVTNDNLSYPGLPASSGNAIYIPPLTGLMGRMTVPFQVASGQAYFSFVLKVTDISTLSTTAIANMFAAFGDNVGSQSAALARAQSYVVAQKSGAGYILGVGKNKPSVANCTYDSTVHSVGEVLFIVGSYDYGATGHPASLWINPVASSFGAAAAPTATLTITNGTDLNPPGIQSFMLGCFTNAPPGCVVDDVRVGKTWAVVTGAPDINTASTNLTVDAGTTLTLPAFAIGGSPLSYQWMKGAVNLSNGGNISGAKSSTLTLANLTHADVDTYSLIVTNSYGSITGVIATLNVNDPAISSQPASQILPPGSSAIFHVTAAGSTPLSYQWVKDGTPLSNGGNISGATGTNLTVSGISFADQGSYSVFVTNSLNTVLQSATATLAVTDPAITNQPQSLTNNYGTTATFQVSAVGLTTLTYLWHKTGVGDLSDGGNISGSHSRTLTISGVSYTDNGSYYVTVTDNAGNTDSSTATLSVIEPIITSQPSSVTNMSGTTATFSVGAIGAAPINYQWKKNGGNLTDGGNISGALTSTLSISSVSAGDAASYSVTVSDASGTNVTSTSVMLTVLSPPSIVSQPNSRVIVAGNPAAFALGASGTAPLSYQWLSNGIPISSATAFSYVIANAQAQNSASYSVIVSNAYGSATSSTAVLAVVPSVHLYSTNLMVVRAGDGAQTPVFNGNSVFLDQYTPTGDYVNTVSIPDSGPSAFIEMGPDSNGSTITGTALSRSQNRRYMVLSGYHTAAPYSGALLSSASTAVPRGIGFIDASGQFTLPVSDTNAYSATYFRGAASDGTNNFWGAGNAGGTYYFGLSHPALTVQSSFPNLRSVDIFNGNLYTVSGSSSGIAVLQWTNLPTTAITPTTLFIPGSTPTDLAVDPTGTIIYIGTSIGVMKYTFDGTLWNFGYTLTVGAIRYITVDFSGAAPVIYATTSDSNYNRLLSIVDNSGTASVTTLATAGINQNFRGVRFGPDAGPVISISPAPGNVILTWDPQYSLQASTNVASGYTNVPGATSPYTNSVNSPRQLFFKVQ